MWFIIYILILFKFFGVVLYVVLFFYFTSIGVFLMLYQQYFLCPIIVCSLDVITFVRIANTQLYMWGLLSILFFTFFFDVFIMLTWPNEKQNKTKQNKINKTKAKQVSCLFVFFILCNYVSHPG